MSTVPYRTDSRLLIIRPVNRTFLIPEEGFISCLPCRYFKACPFEEEGYSGKAAIPVTWNSTLGYLMISTTDIPDYSWRAVFPLLLLSFPLTKSYRRWNTIPFYSCRSHSLLMHWWAHSTDRWCVTGDGDSGQSTTLHKPAWWKPAYVLFWHSADGSTWLEEDFPAFHFSTVTFLFPACPRRLFISVSTISVVDVFPFDHSFTISWFGRLLFWCLVFHSLVTRISTSRYSHSTLFSISFRILLRFSLRPVTFVLIGLYNFVWLIRCYHATRFVFLPFRLHSLTYCSCSAFGSLFYAVWWPTVHSRLHLTTDTIIFRRWSTCCSYILGISAQWHFIPTKFIRRYSTVFLFWWLAIQAVPSMILLMTTFYSNHHLPLITVVIHSIPVFIDHLMEFHSWYSFDCDYCLIDFRYTVPTIHYIHFLLRGGEFQYFYTDSVVF